MRVPRSWPLVALAALAAAAPPDGESPFAPLACYKHATDELGLTDQQSVNLCLGATSIAPVRCYQLATTQDALSDLEAIQLCKLATSEEPADCVARLTRTTGYDQATIVGYCSTATYALASPPEPGAASCIQAAKHTLLADPDAVRLCQGSESAAPVECYAWGKAHTLLTDSDTITLCATVVPFALPYGVAVPGMFYPP